MDYVYDMDEVAKTYAHRLALNLECLILECPASARFYDEALQTLGEYRSAMNAIHERISPTHMGEAVLRDRPCTCHSDDNPPKPCAKRYALSECRDADSTVKAYEIYEKWTGKRS